MGGSLLAAGAILGGTTGTYMMLAGGSMLLQGLIGASTAPGVPDARGTMINTRSSDQPVALAYGRVRFGINQCYLHTTGLHNDTLHVVGILGKGPCGDVEEVRIADKLIAEYGGDAEYSYHNGAIDQDYDATLHGYDERWVDAMRGTAYIRLMLHYNPDKFTGLGEITVTLKGRLLYDPRTETTTWSRNGALVARDLATNRSGVGIPTDYIDDDAISVAATWCDTNEYYWDGCLQQRGAALDLFDRVLENFRAVRIWSDDKLRIKILDYDSPVMTIGDDDIIEDSERAAAPCTKETYNAAQITFVNAAQGYVSEPLPMSDQTAVEDDGQTKTLATTLIGTTAVSQAMKLGAYKIDRSRMNRQYLVSCRPRLKALEAGDMVTVTSSAFGFADQVCRVAATAPASDHTVGLTLWKEDPLIYDDSINISSHEIFTTTLFDPLAVPPSVVNIDHDEESYLQGDNTYYRVIVTFDPPPYYPFFKHVTAYVSWDNGANYRSLGKVDTGFTIENLREGQAFKVKLCTVSNHDVAQPIDSVSAIDITVLGLEDPPSNVGGFQAVCARQDVNFKWTAVSDRDLLLYELRYGMSWSQSILLTSTKATMYSINSIRPAVHTFLIKAKNTAGIYSALPATVSVTTYVPVAYTEEAGSPHNEDYDSGTHNQTYWYDDPLYGRLLMTGIQGILAPNNILAEISGTTITISWDSVVGATSYNIYWSTSPGVTKGTGTKIGGVTSPRAHTDRTNGTPYYYVVTAENNEEESEESDEVSAITGFVPENVWASGYDETVYIQWIGKSGVTSYNIYWATSPGVTKETGTKIEGTTGTYFVHTGRTNTTKYYYVVTALKNVAEGEISAEANAYATGWATTDMMVAYGLNGGFENWITDTSPALWPDAQYVQKESTIKNEGAYSCKFGYGEGTLGYISMASSGPIDSLTVGPGAIKVTLTHKSSADNKFTFYASDWGGGYIVCSATSTQQEIASTTEWATTEIMVPSACVGSLWVVDIGNYLELVGSIATLYVDSIKIYATTGSTKNPGFTNGLTHWTKTTAGTSTIYRKGTECPMCSEYFSYYELSDHATVLDIDASNSQAKLSQSVTDFAATQPSTLFVHHQESNGTATAKYYIYSETDAKYLQADGSWNAVSHWFAIPNHYDAENATWEHVSKDFTTASAGNYTIAVQNDSAASAIIWISGIYTMTTRP
jgi:hypothetical protein